MERKVELAVKADCLLGEGPLWDDEEQCLYWTDIERGEIYIYSEKTGQVRKVKMEGKVTSIALCTDQRLLIAKTDTIILYDRNSGEEKTVVHRTLPENIRFNDGKCDPKGRFYADSMDMTEKTDQGALFMLNADGSFREVASGFIIGNGMAWNAEETVMYVADSTVKTVYRFDYNAETGKVSNRSIAIHIPEGEGVPDGMCIDSEGMLWVAHYYGARITRWNPVTGERLETIPIPACNVTSCCFGGADLKTLYITTSNMNLTNQQIENRNDGSVFRIRTDVKGCKTVRFPSRNL